MKLKFYPFVFFAGILVSSAQDTQKVWMAANKIIEERSPTNMDGYWQRIAVHDVFKKQFSTGDLAVLVDHPDVRVKYYSFWVLSEDHTQDLLPFIAKYVNDSTKLANCHVCSGTGSRSRLLGDVLINLYTEPGMDRRQRVIKPADQKYLDSLVIFSPLWLQSRAYALSRVNGNPDWYPRIRELVVRDNYLLAIRALAIYRKQEDVAVIRSLRTSEKKLPEGYSYICYDAMRLFPDSAFKNDLEEDLAQMLKKKVGDYNEASLCEAIVAYRDAWARGMLTTIMHTPRPADLKQRSMSNLSLALTRYGDSSYTKILWELWEKEGWISAATIKLLQKDDAGRCYRNARKNASSFSGFHSNDLAPDIIYYLQFTGDSIHENIYNSLLQIVRQRDPKAEVDIVCKQLVRSDRMVVSVFINETILRKDQAFVEPLLTRLGKEDDPDVFKPLIKTLLEYKDDKVNTKLIDVLRTSPNLSEVLDGDYEDAIPRLMARYKVK